MVSITQSQRWRQQPSGPTQIDRSHPMARGLVFAIVGNMPNAEEMVSGNLSQPLGTSSTETFPTGVGLYSPSNVGNGWYANYDRNVFRTIGTEFTIACEFVAESLGDVSVLVGAPWANGSYAAPKVSFCLRRVQTTSTMMIEIGTTSATNINATFSNAMISNGERATYVAVRNGATASLMRDNVPMTQAGSGLTSGANVGYDTASHVCLMNRNASSMGNGTGGGILWTYIWNRALSDREQQDIYYKPYDIILPVDRTRYYLVSAPNGYAGTLTAASKVPTATASGSITIPNRTGVSAVSNRKATVAAIGSATARGSTGTSALPGKTSSVSASGARTLPSRSGTLASTAPSTHVSIAGTRTSPARTGNSALSARKQVLVGVGIIPVLGSAFLGAPKARSIAFAPNASVTEKGVLLSRQCADVMLSAIGTTLNSGFVRIYSGSEPATATAGLNGNIQLAELSFGPTAFGVPASVNESRVIIANLMTNDSSADANGVATFFRAFRSDGTVIWQGSAGSGKELILQGSGTNPYQVKQGGPVNVISLTVSISLF